MSLRSPSGAIFLPCAVLLLLVQSWGTWKLRRYPVIPHTPPLAEFPSAINGWKSIGFLSSDSQPLRTLSADEILTRNYKDQKSGRTVTLLISYYRTQLRTHPAYHSPENAPNTGWSYLFSTIIELPADSNQAVPVRCDLVVRGQDHRLVLNWLQTKTRVLTDAQKLHLYRTIDAIFHRRTDLAFVQIVTPVVDGESDQANQTVVEFAEGVRRRVQALLFAP
jgi:EpsI family protein